MNIKNTIKKLKSKLKAIYLAYKHRDTPIIAKLSAGFTIMYALSPIDLIPDFIPILGYLDDLIILPLLISLSIRLIPKEIMRECEEKSKDLWKDGKPKRWMYAIPVVVVWFVVIVLIMSKLFIK